MEIEQSRLLEKQIFNDYCYYINNNLSHCKEKSKDIYEYLKASALYQNNQFVSESLMIPKVYSRDTINIFSDIVNKIHNIVLKVIKEYLNNEEYRKIFPFEDSLVELILTNPGYPELLPIIRYDLFYNEENGDYMFCEFNTDGTSGMNKIRIHEDSFIDNPAHEYILSKYKLSSFELFESLIDEFLSNYKTYNKASSIPNVAIVDFLDKGNVREFKEFANRFRKRGIPCRICDIRDFVYENNKLKTKDGYYVDAIYRRAVTADIIDNINEVLPVINAYKDNNVFICGSLITEIPHTKWIFNALYNDKTHAFLSDEEIDFIKEHIPKTLLFNDENLKKETLIHKDSYILKPIDAYDGKGVYAGISINNNEWSSIVESCFNNGFILQDYCPQYKTKNIDLVFGDDNFRDYINITGLYVYNGNLSGVYSRLSSFDTVCAQTEEKTVPCFIV